MVGPPNFYLACFVLLFFWSLGARMGVEELKGWGEDRDVRERRVEKFTG